MQIKINETTISVVARPVIDAFQNVRWQWTAVPQTAPGFTFLKTNRISTAHNAMWSANLYDSVTEAVNTGANIIARKLITHPKCIKPFSELPELPSSLDPYVEAR